MGIKDFIERMSEKSRERKAMLNQIQDQLRLQKIAEDRMKSSNERELDRFVIEEREDNIKQALEVMRKKREQDIRFNHNPLDTPNITNHVDWEVMKEKNLFSNNRNMFVGQKSVLKNDNKLLRNNKKLFSGRCTL